MAIAVTKPAGAAASGLLAAEPQLPTISLDAALFPESVPGYDQELGITLPAVIALGPAQQGVGIHDGPMIIIPAVAVNAGYDSDVLGYRHAPGSSILSSTPSVTVDGVWSRTRVGLYLGVNNNQYFDLPSQSYTDVKFGAGGSMAVGRGELTFAYSHLALHEDPAAIGAIPSSSPSAFTVDDARATLEVDLGRAALSPFIDVSHWTNGPANIDGATVDQSFLDRDVLQAGVAGRYQVGERRDLLGTISVVRNDYLHSQPGAALPSSTDVLALGGVDYEVNGALHMRVLAGVQGRRYDSATYSNLVAPVGQASVFWTPQRITTVSFTLARSLEDLAQIDTVGTIFSRAQLAVAHELDRALLLRTRLGVESAQFLQLHGTQADAYCDTGFEWSFNRRAKLVGDVELQRNSAPIFIGPAPPSGPYSRALAHIGVTIGI